jgi:hypothetical protein
MAEYGLHIWKITGGISFAKLVEIVEYDNKEHALHSARYEYKKLGSEFIIEVVRADGYIIWRDGKKT